MTVKRLGKRSVAAARAAWSRVLGAPAAMSVPASTVKGENEAWWADYAAAARQGFDRLHLLLSFDCDRHEDADVVLTVDSWLRERNLARTYAVPGVMLKQAADVYARLAQDGARFINHGGRAHTEYRDGRYWSVTFYDRFSEAEAAEDIEAGHQAVLEVTGQRPIGFRAPHFGLLKTREQRENVYRTLRRLGYRFSSSTLPGAATDGPMVDVGGLAEFPCSGSWAYPQVVFDSWSCVESPYRAVVTAAHGEAMLQTIVGLTGLGVTGVLNWYADPSHLGDGDGFRRALDKAVDLSVPGIGFEELLPESSFERQK
jgi:peptidoglycan/xylan/chitin deacetylase (PgdA/CDA1 family)